jgi:uncharacterized membrane protein YphA (DoxX/SURF4 family)
MTTDTKQRKIAYWIATGLVAAMFAFSGLSDLFPPPEMIEGIEKLGYPLYLLPLLGVAKLLAVPALLVPRFARLKEWAYAGLTFNMLGASYSHVMAGDGPQQILTPIVLLGLIMASYFLRPATRRLPELPAAAPKPPKTPTAETPTSQT